MKTSSYYAIGRKEGYLSSELASYRAAFLPVLAQLATNPTLVDELNGTGQIAIEAHFRRGLDAGIKIQTSQAERQADPELCTLLSDTLQIAGEGLLSKSAAGGPSNPTATGEALAKKQAKRQ